MSFAFKRIHRGRCEKLKSKFVQRSARLHHCRIHLSPVYFTPRWLSLSLRKYTEPSCPGRKHTTFCAAREQSREETEKWKKKKRKKICEKKCGPMSSNKTMTMKQAPGIRRNICATSLLSLCCSAQRNHCPWSCVFECFVLQCRRIGVDYATIATIKADKIEFAEMNETTAPSARSDERWYPLTVSVCGCVCGAPLVISIFRSKHEVWLHLSRENVSS